MAGQLKINGVQFGTDATATNNLVMTTTATPNGSLTISRGNLGATTSDILYIGPNGNITLQPTGASITNLSAINGSQLGGFRNKIINGDMRVAQRAYYSSNSSVAAVAGTYTLGGADRIKSSINVVGGSLTSGTIRVFNGGLSTYLGTGASHGMTATTSGTAGSVLFTQFIEAANTWDLNSQVVTVSAKVYQDTGASAAAVITLARPASAANAFGNAPTVISSVGSLTVPSGVLTTITATFTLGAADATWGLAPIVTLPFAGAISSKTFTITDFQLEQSPVATPYERKPYGVELAACERYLQVMLYGAVGVTNSTTTGFVGLRLKPFFAVPTYAATGSIALTIATVAVTATFAGGDVRTDGSGSLSFSGFSPATANGAVLLISTANNSYIVFTAEVP